jgi:hypothetical protein
MSCVVFGKYIKNVFFCKAIVLLVEDIRASSVASLLLQTLR